MRRKCIDKNYRSNYMCADLQRMLCYIVIFMIFLLFQYGLERGKVIYLIRNNCMQSIIT